MASEEQNQVVSFLSQFFNVFELDLIWTIPSSSEKKLPFLTGQKINVEKTFFKLTNSDVKEFWKCGKIMSQKLALENLGNHVRIFLYFTKKYLQCATQNLLRFESSYILWESHKILRNLHLTFVYSTVQRLRKILWSSQNVWTLLQCLICALHFLFFYGIYSRNLERKNYQAFCL